MSTRPRRQPTAPLRPAPRPLPLHLLTQLALLNSSRSALPLWKNGSLRWRPELQPKAEALTQSLSDLDADTLRELDLALMEECTRRHASMLQGIDGYRRHGYRRQVPQRPVYWQQGCSQIRDFSGRRERGGRVLLVPSLINRSYILNLTRRFSLAGHLARLGTRPLLLDWGEPDVAERAFDLTAYVRRLCDAIDHIVQREGKPVVLVGYCMGGDLALAAALHCPDQVAGLALLATPWDYHGGNSGHGALLRAMEPSLRPVIEDLGYLPVDLLQAMFASLDPTLAGRKFAAFSRLDHRTSAARSFVAVEEWANDGVILSGPVALECLFGWYGRNDPASGRWRIDSVPVRPQDLTIPCLCMVPRRDRIVPAASATALAAAIPGANLCMVQGGHVGMLLSERSRDEVYAPLAAWIRSTLERFDGCAGPRHRAI